MVIVDSEDMAEVLAAGLAEDLRAAVSAGLAEDLQGAVEPREAGNVVL